MKATLLAMALVISGTTHLPAQGDTKPHGYRHVNLQKPYERTHGGYWWTAGDGTIYEEGISIQGRPLLCSRDTLVVLNAATAEAGDLHFVDGDIRRTWANGARTTGLHLFTRLSQDTLVGNWASYVPTLLRYKPGVLIEDTRRPGLTETFGVKHNVGALVYDTLRAKESPLEVRQSWYIPSKWCVVNQVEIRNLTEAADDGASVAVTMALRSPITTDRKQLDWYADFHSQGKAGMPMVPRLTDDEYQRLLKLTEFEVEYRENDRCIVARTGCDVRAPKASYYFMCLMLDAPVARHVFEDGGKSGQSSLFAEGRSYPRQLVTKGAVVGLRSHDVRLDPKGSHTVKYAIAFGKTADEAVANARNGLAIGLAEANKKLDEYWNKRVPALATGNPTLNSLLKYAAITQDANWEPDGRAPGDFGGWGRPARAEVCGYKNYYDQDDMVVPILDVPVYDPQLMKKALLYDIDPQTGRLRKLAIWRQQYDNMLYWPAGVYKVWAATRDDAFLGKMYPALDKTLRWLHETRTDESRLLRMLTMPYDMLMVGLGDDRTVSTKAQAVALDAFRTMRNMARHLNQPQDADFYDSWSAQVRKATNTKLWRGKFYGFSTDFLDNLDLSGNAAAINAGLADEKQAAAILREVDLLYTGTGFPEMHPPLPAWVGTPPWGYQNGRQYVDQLALLARAANKTRNAALLSRVFFEYKRIIQRTHDFPVEIHPWNADAPVGANEIHTASGLLACLIYGVAGIQEEERLGFRPILIPEMRGRVEIRDYLFQGTRFDIRLEGAGSTVQAVAVDGKSVAGSTIPDEYYDGKRHAIVVRCGRAASVAGR
jgi:hypothetical protein